MIHADNGAAIVALDGSRKPVRNLGWVLRNWRHIESITVRELAEVDTCRSSWDCVFVATMRDGRSYVTAWASRDVCRDWLRRPTMQGLPLDWFGEATAC